MCGMASSDVLESANLQVPLRDLAQELRAWDSTRRKAAHSRRVLCEALCQAAIALQQDSTRRSTGGKGPCPQSVDARAVQPVTSPGSLSLSIEVSPESSSRSLFSPPSRGFIGQNGLEGKGIKTPAVCISTDEEILSLGRPEVWQHEVLGRIWDSMQRSRRDPRELFFTFCSSDRMWSRADLDRVLQEFEPNTSEVFRKKLWQGLGKSDGQKISYDEFQRACGQSSLIPEMSDQSLSNIDCSDYSLEVPATTSSPKAAAIDHFLFATGSPKGSLFNRRSSKNIGERRGPVLLYRLGRVMVFKPGLQKELLKATSHGGLSMPAFLTICGNHKVPLSRAEVVALHHMYKECNVLPAKVIDEALQAGQARPPPEVLSSMRLIASAGQAACSEGGTALANALARLGCGHEFADAVDVQELLIQHALLEEQGLWDELLLSLDKTPEGRVLLEPLVQWSAGVGLHDADIAAGQFSAVDAEVKSASCECAHQRHPAVQEAEFVGDGDKAHALPCKRSLRDLKTPVQEEVTCSEATSAKHESMGHIVGKCKHCHNTGYDFLGKLCSCECGHMQISCKTEEPKSSNSQLQEQPEERPLPAEPPPLTLQSQKRVEGRPPTARASKRSKEEEKRKVFETIDVHHRGVLHEEDLYSFMADYLGFGQTEVEDFFSRHKDSSNPTGVTFNGFQTGYPQLNPYVVEQRTDQKIIRKPGSINGEMMTFDQMLNCEVYMCDVADQIFVDRCNGCVFMLGPCKSAIFVRDCEDCVLWIAAQQLRTNNCKRCTFFLYSKTEPIIETSEDLVFAPWAAQYPKCTEHFLKSGFDPQRNMWNAVYDFQGRANGTNWRISMLEAVLELVVELVEPDDRASGPDNPVPKVTYEMLCAEPLQSEDSCGQGMVSIPQSRPNKPPAPASTQIQKVIIRDGEHCKPVGARRFEAYLDIDDGQGE